MKYQAYRPITKSRQSNKQKYQNWNNFANHNYDFFANNYINRPITKPTYKPDHQNQLHEQIYNKQIPQPAPQSVFFNEQQETTADRIENYPFVQKNRHPSNKQFTRNQPNC